MDVSGKLHALATLLPGKETLTILDVKRIYLHCTGNVIKITNCTHPDFNIFV
jgi:hypothetical protein